ncbi:rab11 family-interacting protein 4B-like isoform X10 [Portunus trituberculatus]|uniref:rab11 family-interacting protein 4B-like isoform X10 n=1 Tax=Portunus trituberculatus TaxID=210409 RepID=UPI001E1CD6C7|nr:rab11 family-interacting protein 4B-like isoform X10 [Portunus trituberculatus]
MAVSEEFVEQLREVFRVCDVEHKGTISLPHLLTLAGEHFGSSQNSVTSAVAGLGVTGDVITFPQFCEVVATILTSHGNAEEAVSSPVWEEDYLDGAGPSRLQSHVKEAEDDDGRGRERGERRKRGGEGLAEEEEEEEDLSFTPVVGRGGGGGGVGGLGAWRRRRRRKRGVLERRTMPGEYLSSPSPSLSPLTDGDSAIGGSTASPDSSRKTHSGCSSMSDREEENFECYGEADDLDADSDSARLGSEKARQKAGEEDLLFLDPDLQQHPDYLQVKVQMLQQQVGVLAENQSNTDDRFSRVRQDNAAYQERVVMLEEQLREAEHRYEERRAEEQRRSRELLTRVEREKQLTVENFTIKLASLEKDKTALEEELRRTKALLEKLQKEKESLEDRVSEAEFTASALHQENAKMVEQGRRRDDEGKVERERSAQVIEELRCEIERLRAAEEAARKRAPSVDASSSPPPELQATLQRLREENKGLVEQVEDLQAQLLTSHLEEGRTLVTATNNNSLAAEFEAMTSEEGNHYGSDTVEKLKKSLKDSQEANQHLRAYIDGILLNIVENYPQLLEVKQPK